jgi:putative transcriptional regulator
VVAILGLVCVQVVIVCTWQLLTLVRDDRIFSAVSLVWVDTIVGAIGAADAVLLGALVWSALTWEHPGLPVALLVVRWRSRARVARGGDARVAAAGDDAAGRHGSGHLMPIVVRIDVELARRKMSVGEFAERVGLTPANVAVLKNGRAKAVRFSTLEAMCRVLGCQPGDLLEWVEDDRDAPHAAREARR